jgi:hypothetical protein
MDTHRALPHKKINNLSVFPISDLYTEDVQIHKLNKFACGALKGRGAKNGILIIYAFHCRSCKVDFIEMYFKGEKENKDREK